MELSWNEFLDAIERSKGIPALREARDRIHERLQASPLSLHPTDWNELINRVHDKLIREAVVQAEITLRNDSWGNPPTPYAFVLFGSGGRREQTLWSDQDNGLLYEDPEPEHAQAAAAYYKRLAEQIVQNLKEVGYPPCEGNVSCANEMWQKSKSEWIKMIRSMAAEPDWERVRYLLIMADSRFLYGADLCRMAIADELAACVEQEPSLLKVMLRNTLRRKVALGLLGHLITERYGEDTGGVDIKYGAYIPFVNGIRLLSIRYGIKETGTLERLAALLARGHLTDDQAREWKDAFVTVMKLRYMAANRLEEGFYESSGIVPAKLLTKELKRELKDALRVGEKIHKYVEREIEHLEIGE